jgi:hypothetical protein
MIDELKSELEKTFNRKIEDRGDCEALVQDIYEKTGAVLSYNTIRRLYGLAEFRKPRESTLNYLAKYCGFLSFKDFSQRFSEVDTWPLWEHLYVVLSEQDPHKIREFLYMRKRQEDQFSVTFTIVVRELLNRGDLSTLLLIFRDPGFQFNALPYDQVAQIGVLIGLHFRDFHHQELEEVLLLEPNFRDIVVKIFVDYMHLNGNYGNWLNFLHNLPQLDEETRVFVNCLLIWKQLLNQEEIEVQDLKKLPELSSAQHPILFGRLFGLKMLAAKTKEAKQKLKIVMEARLKAEPHFTTELLYEPAVQALVLTSEAHEQILIEHMSNINQINFWYHFSQVAIHRVSQVKFLLKTDRFQKANAVLNEIPYGHIRHGYREFIELYVSFFRWKIALGLKEPEKEYYKEFLSRKARLNYPIFTDAYFDNYFEEMTSIN